MLQLCGLTVRFGSRTVLDDLSFDVPSGEVVGLLGPNGAGKTTAMRVVFGVVEPQAGEVRWNGRPAVAADRATWGYMTQEDRKSTRLNSSHLVMSYAVFCLKK